MHVIWCGFHRIKWKSFSYNLHCLTVHCPAERHIEDYGNERLYTIFNNIKIYVVWISLAGMIRPNVSQQDISQIITLPLTYHFPQSAPWCHSFHRKMKQMKLYTLLKRKWDLSRQDNFIWPMQVCCTHTHTSHSSSNSEETRH